MHRHRGPISFTAGWDLDGYRIGGAAAGADTDCARPAGDGSTDGQVFRLRDQEDLLPSRALRRGLIACALSLSALAAAPAAHAGLLVASAPSCDVQDVSQPFLPFGDPASYTLAPDGGLEHGGASWTLAGGAAVVAGNESYQVGGDGDATALSLPPGSSATTSSMCIGIEHPDMRFFVRRTGGSLLSTLRVDAVFEDAAGNAHSAPIAFVGGSRSWAPTLPVPLVVNLLPLLPGEHTPVEFRFRPTDGATWTVDDVYVDPPKRCC